MSAKELLHKGQTSPKLTGGRQVIALAIILERSGECSDRLRFVTFLRFICLLKPIIYWLNGTEHPLSCVITRGFITRCVFIANSRVSLTEKQQQLHQSQTNR